MADSLRALLTGIIDYAGLFPPAALPLEQAFRAFAHARQEPAGWLLARFVCPAKRLDELTPFVPELFASGTPLIVTVLNSAQRPGDFLIDLIHDLAPLTGFQRRHGNRVCTEALELRQPGERVNPAKVTAALVDFPYLRSGIQSVSSLYCEVPLGAEWEANLRQTLAALADVQPHRRDDQRSQELTYGLKLRCGGPTAAAVPTSEQVAGVIAACREAGVPLKFTAGLHQPLRHFDAGLQTVVHGFVNLFVAGVLAHALRLNAEQLRAVIDDTDPGHFRFDDAGLSWQNYQVSTVAIREARRHGVTSFGSCSYEEPRDGLQKLGWLPR